MNARHGLDAPDRATTEAYVKGLIASGRDRLPDLTPAGVHSGDPIAQFMSAMQHRLGPGKIHFCPPLAEANTRAAGEWRRAHGNPRRLILAKPFHDWRPG